MVAREEEGRRLGQLGGTVRGVSSDMHKLINYVLVSGLLQIANHNDHHHTGHQYHKACT